MRPDWAYNYQNSIAAEEAEGKTVAFVDDGIEETVIGFEDETFIEFYTWTGNSRDL